MQVESHLCHFGAAAELKNLSLFRQFVRKSALDLQADSEAVDDLVLAVNEVVTNTIEHGYQGDPGEIELDMWGEGDSIVVRVKDDAPLFDPTNVEPPDLRLPLARRPLGKVGMFLTIELMDAVTYAVSSEGRNELTLTRRKKSE